MPPKTRNPRAGVRVHRLHVDGFTLPPLPGQDESAGALVLLSCPTCHLHARIVASAGSAQGLADVVVQAHWQAERERQLDRDYDR